MSILDLIFPKKCVGCRKLGDFLCADCFSQVSYNQNYICPECFSPCVNGFTHPVCFKRYCLDGAISTVVYNTMVKRIIRQFKYKPYVSKLSEIIGGIMNEGLSQNESFYRFIERFESIVIPVPLSVKRFRERGYNHAQILASCVAKYFGLAMKPNILVRVRNTKPQYKLNRKERLTNIQGAFDIASEQSQVPKSMILIDDIATSFATLKEAAKTLKLKGAKRVLGVTFAKEL